MRNLRRENVVKPVCLLVLLSMFTASLLVNRTQSVAGSDGSLALQAPSFVRIASAAEALTGAPDRIATEAGISAYFDANRTINLNQVRSQFRTIEEDNSNYILGSVAIPEWDDGRDAHVYVAADGWVLAYYGSAEPTSIIFDWHAIDAAGQNTVVTTLESALYKMASAAAVGSPSLTYYDFRYPNATNLTLVMDYGGESDKFEITLPSSLIYYEHSWSLFNNIDGCCGGTTLKLNDNELGYTSDDLTALEGFLSNTLLPRDQLNEFEVSQSYFDNTRAFGGFAVTYQE